MADIPKDSDVEPPAPLDVTEGETSSEITSPSENGQVYENVEKERQSVTDVPIDITPPEEPTLDVNGTPSPAEDEPEENTQFIEKFGEEGLDSNKLPIDGTLPEEAKEDVNDEPTSTDVAREDDPLQSKGLDLNKAELPIQSNLPSVLLNDRYDVFPSNRLPEFDSPSARAFEAKDQKRPDLQMFALICLPELSVRKDIVDHIARQRISGILGLLDYGVINWPVRNHKTLILIYERPLGGRVYDVIVQETSEYKKIDYIRASVDGMIEGIKQLNERGITHRALRHNNLFFLDEAKELVVLGDFVSSPAGFDQPVVYETIEKSMADEGGRGIGLIADDMYALGVTLAFLVQKQLPVFGNSKEQIILKKIERSTYRAIVGKNLITATMLEPMRGLLNDDPAERWSIEHLENWKSGLPNIINPMIPPERAHRPITLDGFDHLYPRGLAYSMAQRPEAAIKLIKEGSIERWIKKDLMNEELSASFAECIDLTKLQSEKTKEGDHLLLAQVLILLDPLAPIRYKGVSYMPDAFGTALVTEHARNGDPRILAESVVYKVIDTWVEANRWLQPRTVAQIEHLNYARIRTYLQRAALGYGLERCMYELNQGFPCKSPSLENDYILSVEDILPALDEAEKRVDSKTSPVDRHIAAFVAVKLKQPIDHFLNEIADPDEAVNILGTLRLLALLQNLYGPETLMGLSKWVGGQMGPVIKLYQSRSTRKILEAKEPVIVRNGKLDELLTLLDAPDARVNDEEGYEQAIKKFRTAQEESEKIEHDIGPNSDKAQEASKQVAVVTSGIIMTFVLVIMVIAG